MEIKQKTISSIKWTGLSNIFNSGISFLQIAILSRLLSPKEFGLFAIVSAIIGYIQLFSDLGTGISVIYKRNITELQLSSLYWLNFICNQLA